VQPTGATRVKSDKEIIMSDFRKLMEALKSSPQQEAFDRTNKYMSLFLQSLDSIDADELDISQEDADKMTSELLDQLKYELAQKGFS